MDPGGARWSMEMTHMGGLSLCHESPYLLHRMTEDKLTCEVFNVIYKMWKYIQTAQKFVFKLY